MNESEYPCPNCHQMMSSKQGYCPHCGYGKSKPNPWLVALSIVLLIVVGIPSACIGTCLLMLGASSGFHVVDWPMWLLIAGMLTLAGAIVAFLVATLRRR